MRRARQADVTPDGLVGLYAIHDDVCRTRAAVADLLVEAWLGGLHRWGKGA